MNILNLILFLTCTVLVPFLVSWFVCPKIVRLAKEKNLTDCPGNRKLQKKPVPVIGGVCVFTSVVISLALCIVMDNFFNLDIKVSSYCMVAFSLIFLVGFFDDMVDLSAYIKFVFQFLAIYLLFEDGYTIDTFNGLFGVTHLPYDVSLGLSLIAGVGLMNAVNMIDGVNGLSSSVGMSFCIVSAVLLIMLGDYNNSAIALIFMASLIPFFIANAFSYKYKMFIGDSGALMLGCLAYMLACSLMHGVQGGGLGEMAYRHSVALVIAIFAMPVGDTLRVMTMRVLKGRSPFSADKTHLHHIFLELKIPHLAVTASIVILGVIIFCSWLATNWLIEPAWLQLLVVVLVAMTCCWGTYAYLSNVRTRNNVKFERMISALSGISRRIRSFRHKIEVKYDRRLDRKGYTVMEFDVDDKMIEEMIRKLQSEKEGRKIASGGTNYHAIYQEKILRYVASMEEVTVDNVIACCEDHKLRVYPILFELEQAGLIIVSKRDGFGAPEKVKLNVMKTKNRNIDMENKDFAAENRRLIEDYLKGKDAVNVKDIMSIEGVTKMRVYPILFQMEVEDGVLEVLEREGLGSPKVVRLKKLKS